MANDNTYEAGALNLSIYGVSDSAVTSIERTVKALNSLSRSLRTMEQVSFSTAGSKLEIFFTKMAKATNSINTKNIENLAGASKALGSLTKIGKLQDLDYGKIGNGFSNLTTAISPFVDKVKEAETALTSLYGILSKSSGKKIQSLLDDGGGAKKKGNLLNTASWTAVIYSARKLGKYVYNISEAGAEYTETLNYWEVAMDGNIDKATIFINKLNEVYGISKSSAMSAQATFKNMLGSLGQISDTMAYSFSKGVTQMALDYASLYNVSFDEAFTKFQAALAGQVRPIRSGSGYDITENTLFQLYQSMGGEKTMRQLSRTEKQLLSIYAIFNQMDNSKTIGDLSKTMSSFANQARVAADSMEDVKKWLGVIFNYIITETKIMVKFNAIVISLARVLEATAIQIGAIQSFNDEQKKLPDIFGDTENSADAAADAIDKLSGKLLDFDKFRSLSSSQDSNIALDEKILSAFGEYDTILEKARLEARELSTEWLKLYGFSVDENDQLTLTADVIEKIQNKVDVLKATIGGFDGKAALDILLNSLSSLSTLLVEISPSIFIISKATTPILVSTIKIIASIVQLLDKLGLLRFAIFSIVSLKIGAKIIQFTKDISAVTPIIKKLSGVIQGVTGKFNALEFAMVGVSTAFALVSFRKFMDTEMSSGKRMVTMFIAIAGAVTAAAVAFKLLSGNWAGALTAAGIVAGTIFSISAATPDFYAKGASDIMGGTMFVAGENGRTEAVYSGNNGKSNVANVQQMEQAFFNALSRYASSNKGKIEVNVNMDGRTVYKNVTAHAKSDGLVWAKA